ncbi:MAG: S9 family peptidase [Acidobacteria bacterium]|nr:S9 family peptidase [Acidobacteriota bacterium]MBI3662910.1 S9 family peptidase [Acidobacteriota bacterium]
MKRIAGLVFLFVLLVAVAFAGDEKFTLQQVLSSPFPSEMTAAPKGSRIAWVFRAQGQRNIWVAEGPKFAARHLTSYNKDDGQEITSLAFSASGNTLVYVRGGSKNQAGEVPNPANNPEGADQAIWSIAWTGGAPKKIDLGNSPVVSPGRTDAAALVAYVKENQIWLAPISGVGKPRQIVERGQNSSPVWSPDGKKLAFISNRTTHSLIAIYDTAKKSIRFVAPSVDRDGNPRWSPDGQSIAFVRTPARPTGPAPGFWTGPDAPSPWAIWIAGLASGSARQIWRSADNVESNIPRMAGPALLNWAAGGRIVFASEMDGWLHLYSMSSTGDSPILLTPGECEFEQATFTPDLRSIVFASNCGDIDRRHISRVSVAGPETSGPEVLTSGDGIEWAPVVTGDGKSIAYFASDARLPAMPHVRGATATGKGEMLAKSALPKDFPSEKLVVPQQVILKSADGVECHSQLFLPAGLKPGEKRPAVIFMHGGPMRQMMLGWHNRGYYHQAYAVNQYFASRGYIVLSVNYRSGIMYGRAFREAKDRGARGASEYQDIVAAGKYLAARPDVDPRRVGLWGGSYGGYLTALGLARDSDLFAAGVDLHGVHDWSQRDIAGVPLPADAAKLARDSSPVASIEKWKSPVLLIQGDDDRNVAFAQMVDLVARLRRQGVYFEQMVYPDEVHDFLLHSNWLHIYSAAFDFFERKMSGK